MPVPGTDTRVYSYELGNLGINLHDPTSKIKTGECLLSQNLVWRNGMIKRPGGAVFEADEVVADNRIVGLHRFYRSGAAALLIVASETKVKYHNGTTWAAIDATVGQSQTSNKQTHFATWGAVDKVFGANGTDTPFSWDGTTAATLTGTNAPSKAIQFLPYQDRLLAIDANNEGDLNWSKSYDETDWESIANCGVRPDTRLFGMLIHSLTNSSAGFQSKVLLAGASGMYLFGGTDLLVPFATGNYSIFPLSTNVGCNAPRTMSWTPAGSMWLGIDRQVYLLPFNSSVPIPVGDKIRSNGDTEGIESIPIAQIENACAVYHNGYYKLSITRSGQTTNDRQWWLDVRRLGQDENGLWGPWYGPMIGENINCFAIQGGNADGGELMAGDSRSSTGTSLVYQVSQNGVYGDAGSAIQTEFKTYFHMLGNPLVKKEVHRTELELLDINGTVNVDFHDISGSISTTKSLSLTGGALLWNGAINWDGDSNWSAEKPIYKVVEVSPAITPRKLSTIVKNNSSDTNFELYGINIESVEGREVFG